MLALPIVAVVMACLLIFVTTQRPRLLREGKVSQLRALLIVTLVMAVITTVLGVAAFVS